MYTELVPKTGYTLVIFISHHNLFGIMYIIYLESSTV